MFRHALALAVVSAVTTSATVTWTRSADAATIDGQRSTGSVLLRVTTADGAPIPNAVISLQGDANVKSGRSDAAGLYVLPELAPGTYAVRVNATGFEALGPRPFAVARHATTQITLALLRSSTSLATIGRVQTNGSESLSTSSAPLATLNPQVYAAEGYTRISDVLADDISTTLVHPIGAGSTVLPTSVALRGPDPTETLVDVDGHQVNSGSTGDFDLSLLDPADYSGIELVKGISPSSLVGPDTIDGAINLRTIEPTQTPHGLLRLSAGSFNTFAQTLQSTGTHGRLGYAFSLHSATTNGDVNEPIFDSATTAAGVVGSSVNGKTALGKLRYTFGTSGGAYAEVSFHDQSVSRDISAGLSSYPDPPAGGTTNLPGVTSGFEGSSLAAHNASYGLDLRVPLGATNAAGSEPASLLFRNFTSLVSQSVFGPGADTSPYLFNNRDLIGESSLELDKQFVNGSLTLQYTVRNEQLTITDANAGSGDINLESVVRSVPRTLSVRRRPLDDAAIVPASVATGVDNTLLAQMQRAAVIRYIYDPTAKLHLTAAGYYSDYSTFGHQLDPRLGFVYTPDSRTALRFSVGSTFQAPQLPELYVPAVLPAPVDGIITTGNPNLRPDHATEYGIGASRIIVSGSHQTDVAVDVYRVNLRAPASTLQTAQTDTTCGAAAVGGDGTACPLSYAVNAGDGVYRGVEVSAQRRLAPYVTVRAGYAVRSAFLTAIGPEVQDGSLVLYRQDLGLPLQKATLTVAASPPRGFTYRTAFIYEGKYNELNQPPFATLAASVGYRWPSFEFVVSGTNLTNVYNQRFTRANAGVPVDTQSDPLLTNAYALQGAAFNLSIARRF